MPDLRTTFIPKTPASSLTRTPEVPRTVNVIVLLATVVFLVALTGAAGLYFYRAVLARDIERLSGSITRAEEIISPVLVSQLSEFDTRSKIVKNLIDGHMVLSPLFDLLEELVIPNVRFTEFKYALGREGNAKLNLAGEARSYVALASQSDVLGKGGSVRNPIFSNFELNPSGNVTFAFSADIARDAQLFRNTLKTEAPPVVAPPASPQAGTSTPATQGEQ
ncbi:MAG: hypothetical protein A3D67_01940 [Candidatus Lloydbacteria bacterium RIFCSPHIGHO2_02_FULL_51_22]|uniref:PilN domain-containing protein n=3 Tax=Candidatus Lloydiibacteriota TaxID=1817910 RepID=A0A1G2DAF9_9BACT|nr:MAG: hypothetical protein A3D67_01940 [Candidatus Lloydbacteria bacterium RIFCSPHIGHO2_02_FULL_51_22]OGZ15576.1 MAG: hypothetical protein A3J08_01290 [Candidatus Lloydbacteria bacterium RIFCSPLOWO2_02_FULL_51_11]OGZ16312.1 MAG: hypothetical protein A3G11_00250 [Candidatus Lloydbacteria bacterium RIFCSPLOWO2_12_FULL_51_9]